jgi:hypothetical protein
MCLILGAMTTDAPPHKQQLYWHPSDLAVSPTHLNLLPSRLLITTCCLKTKACFKRKQINLSRQYVLEKQKWHVVLLYTMKVLKVLVINGLYF